MNLEHVAIRFMQPRENHNLLTGLDPVEAVDEIRGEFEPRIRASLPALLWSVGALREAGVEPRLSEESRSFSICPYPIHGDRSASVKPRHVMATTDDSIHGS